MTLLGQPYWWDGLTQQRAFDTLPTRCEMLVIGAGYTGLSAAITLARAGVNVCVVDAQYPGFGASSRNGGMVGAHPRQSPAALSSRLGRNLARQILNEAGQAFDYFQSLINDHRIECNYRTTGRIQLAWTRADFAAQQQMAAAMSAQTNFRVKVLEPQELSAHIRTDHYFGGLYYPDHGALHPAKLVQGLLAVAQRMGVTIVSSCAIERIERCAPEFLAHSNRGAITARNILLASNGYTQGKNALLWLKRRVFPLPSFLIATEVLPKTLIKHLLPGERMMVETRAAHSYWRVSPDGKRIIWGGRAALRPINIPCAAQRLQKTMTRIWPALHGTKITHAWSGNTGFTFHHMPHVGTIEGIHFAAGYCGGGVVLAPYLGMKAAYRMLGDPRGDTAFSSTAFSQRWYYSGTRPWFLTPTDYWYRWVIDPLQEITAWRDQQRGR